MKEAAAEEAEAAPEEGAREAHIDSELRVADVMTRDVQTVGRNDKLVAGNGHAPDQYGCALITGCDFA